MTTPASEPAPHDAVPHEFVTDACAHRHHEYCQQLCRYCFATCLCACHRWRISAESR